MVADEVTGECRWCDLKFLYEMAKRGAKSSDELRQVKTSAKKLKEFLREAGVFPLGSKKSRGGGSLELDIIGLLGLKEDELWETAGGALSGLYEDEIVEKVKEFIADKVPPEYTGFVSKIVPSVVAMYFAQKQSGAIGDALTGAALNLRWSAYTELLRQFMKR